MKNILKQIVVLFFLYSLSSSVYAQQLKPGFDAVEYADLLNLEYDSLQTGVSIQNSSFHSYKLFYQSPEVGLFNKCFLWVRSDDVVVLVIRGTISKTESWLENFYSAMIPAKGTLQLNDSTQFEYKFAEKDNAYVHVGWTVGLAHLAPFIISQLNELYKIGMKQVIIFGHSQGGALAYLTRSYLEYLPQNQLPKDIQYKTYCSGAPKPGNLYYAYDFDFITRVGWAFRIVNSADWVPETPLTVQTLNDMNQANPLVNYKESIKDMPWLVRSYLNSAYRKMNNTAEKGVNYYHKYLGHLVYDQVKKTMPQLKEPQYAPSNAYVPAGNQIVLLTDSEYNARFKFTGKNIFVHHLFNPYLFLLKKYYFQPNQ
ncbi:lipase family protein [Solitalea lacus]|uniref:lipase family protein n=1 Tax=Solitalea lacus TaxID=2911172 RepID=UPI001EDA2C13|nr:lipase family protein [Solitalea lacus]UKJ09152.1 lipase family protein [Solitalea lacus]